MPATFSFLTMSKLVLTVAFVAAVSCGSSAFGQVGSGPSLDNVHGIAVEASGDLVVADQDLNALLRVDPVTGDRTIVSRSVPMPSPPPPASNDCWNLTTNIADPDFNVMGTNVSATTQADEQQLENTGSTVWWFFDADSDGMVTINTFGSDFDTQLHIFSGFELGFPNLIPVADNDDAVGLQSDVTFAVTAGTCYEIRIGGFKSTGQTGPGSEGNIVLNGTFEKDAVLLGDVDLNGVVNLLDVAPFIAVLSSGTFQAEADCDENGIVNLLDVDPFIVILSGGS